MGEHTYIIVMVSVTLSCRLLLRYLSNFGQSLAVTSILLRLNSRAVGQNARKWEMKSC